MGLDMYARTIDQRPAKEVDFDIPEDLQSEELHYWRKHPDLHGWMEQLYRQKGGKQETFNCVPVLLDRGDLDKLEQAVRSYGLPKTSGFFFGESGPEDYSDDLEFIAKARAALAEGKQVYYSSWW